ncbi:MAG TPA: hypothetical protein VMW54_07450 [Terriglobia bacterium]|nr:hypothetical protein [Terriglobia bacterium]
MNTGRHERGEIEVECPSCGACLKIDVALGKVIGHELPPRRTETRSLDQASQMLEKEKARREALFQKSTEAEKTKPDLLQRKFEEALRKSKDEPVTRPFRDIDLD